MGVRRVSRVDPHRLELEITETAVMSSADTAHRIIADLRAAGVRISLDDFGTGQSSLGRLRDFIFDKVKIDRAFVSRINSDRASEHIIKAILAMCEGLDLQVVAEGIEDYAEATKLRALGCQPLYLCPYPAHRLPPALRKLPVLHWRERLTSREARARLR